MDEKKKVKILMLGSMDLDLAGHVYATYKNLPECFDKRIVVKYTNSGNTDIALYNAKSFFFRLKRKIDKFTLPIKRLLKYGVVKFKVDEEKKEYCFYDNEIEEISAKQILDKHKGFIPDIISIHWSSNFITSKIIRDLYKLTHAKILMIFVDQAHMTGGCHYPVDCVEYQHSCDKCPAVKLGKILVRKQLEEKIKNLKDIPLTVCGAPYDCMVATKKSALFKGVNVVENVSSPEVIKTPREIARKKFGIKKNDFVVIIGANKITEKRKGSVYAFQALKKLASEYPDVCVLAVGNLDDNEKDELKRSGLNLILPGFLSLEELFVAFSASDCFLSTTIADSGPMMVNYSIALGIPVISFEIGIAHSLVLHKKTGYLADLKNTDDLAAGLKFIKELSPTEWDTMSNECLNLMEYYEKQGSLFNKIYKKFIDGTL